ncbi:hypothetical protein SSCG_06415 [Streptomyces clavuligerus]|nr:hypothetical protein SSCG_06415 [Streptomyces clavuligerus]
MAVPPASPGAREPGAAPWYTRSPQEVATALALAVYSILW